MLPYMKTYAIAIVIGFVLYIYSQPVEGRYISTFQALIGNIDQKYDSSGAARMQYVKASFKSIKIHPMGTGWGSQGWLHSDILQIAASLGIITAIIFIISQITLLLNIYRLMIRGPTFIYNDLFLCFLLFLVFTPYLAPIWLYLVLFGSIWPGLVLFGSVCLRFLFKN